MKCGQPLRASVLRRTSYCIRDTRVDHQQHARLAVRQTNPRHIAQGRTGWSCPAQHTDAGHDRVVLAQQRNWEAHVANGAPDPELLTSDEVDRRLRKAAALMATAHRMAPFDRSTFNAALLTWYSCCPGLLHGAHAPLHAPQVQLRRSCSRRVILPVQEGHSRCATIGQGTAAPDVVTPVRVFCNMLNINCHLSEGPAGQMPNFFDCCMLYICVLTHTPHVAGISSRYG